MKWMLDSDTCIAIIKKQPAQALRKLQGKSVGQVGVSSITLGELAFGAARSTKPKEANAALIEFLLPLEIAAFNGDAATIYGDARASLVRRGTPIGPLDTLIAAHALAIDAVLVSHNTREFMRVEELRLEDWLKKAS